MNRKGLPILTAATLLLAASLPVAWAASGRLQQARVRRLKACVLLLPTPAELLYTQLGISQAGAAIADPEAIDPVRSPDPNPYLFYVLDQRKDVKPDGWEFYNPLAAQYATRQQSERWGNITGNPNALPQGAPLSQANAAYWEVPLNTSTIEGLTQMDVVYVPIGRKRSQGQNSVGIATFFTEEQRRLLTRLADSGVTLWVDWAVQAPTMDGALGGELPPAQRNPFFTNLDFGTGQGAGLAVPPSAGHPLLTFPFSFSGNSDQIGCDYTDGVSYPDGNDQANDNKANPSLGRVVEIRALDMQPTASFTTVVPHQATSMKQGSLYAYIAATRYGAGYVVATAGNVGRAIQKDISPYAVSAQGAAGGTIDLGKAELEDLQFAYNVFGWRGEVTAAQKNGRHVGQSSAPVQGLIQSWTYPDLAPTGVGQPWLPYGASPVANAVSPLIVNGVVISYDQWVGPQGYVSELNAFDINPASSFDSDPYVDDPLTSTDPATHYLADISIGQSYDRFQTLGPSTPGANLGNLPQPYGMTVGEVPANPADPWSRGFNSKPFVFVAGAQHPNNGHPLSTGLYRIPAPRPGLDPSDVWTNGFQKAPDVNINYTGAPGFAIVPGFAGPIAQVYGGGVFTQSAFGSTTGNGKIAAFQINDGSVPMTRVGDFVQTPSWYYPPNQESARMGKISGPVVTAQVEDQGTGAVDTMVIVTSVASGDQSSAQAGASAGDTTGKVEGFVVSTKGDLLSFPIANQAPGANNPAAGRTFVSVRWLNWQPYWGQVPQQNELIWDPTKYYEVRVVDKATGYVAFRFLPGTQGFTLLKNGTAGQVELPPPAGPLARFAVPGSNPPVWNLTDFNLVADYSPLPIPVDNGGGTLRPRFSPATPYQRGAAQNQVVNTGVAGGVAVGRDNLLYYGTGQGYMCAVEWRKGHAQFRWKIKGFEYETAQSATSNDVSAVDATGKPNPNRLADYAFVAAPAAGDRIVFASKGKASAGSADGTVYVMEPDQVIRFKLNYPFPLSPTKAADVVLEADHGVSIPQATGSGNTGILAAQQPWGKVPNQFSVDADTGTVTFLNMENISLDLKDRALTAQQALAQYGVDTGGRPATWIKWWFRQPVGQEPSQSNPAIAVIPLPIVEIYRPAGAGHSWASGPVIAGDKIVLMSADGYLHQLPLDPKKLDPSFPRPLDPSQSFLKNYNAGHVTYGGANGLARVLAVAPNSGAPCLASPAVGDGYVAISSPRGVTLYNSPNIVIADSNRIVEASGDSSALAVTDVTVKERQDNNEFPIPTDAQFTSLGGRPLLRDRKQLSRPAVVRKLNGNSSLTSIFASSAPTLPDDTVTGIAGIKEAPEWAEESYLAADTGNNRIVEFNPAGKVVGEWDRVQDPFKLLPAGEPLTLAGPMDVQRWVEMERIQGTNLPIYVIHTLIADTGNTRVIELVDKVVYQRGAFTTSSYLLAPGQTGADGQPIRWYHVLVWSSQTNAQGLKLRYRTAQRIFWTDATGTPVPAATVTAQNALTAVAPFWLPPERNLSYTMASVLGQQVYYNETGAQVTRNAYFRLWNTNTMPQNVAERKPEVRAGGDTIVFLRGNWKFDETSANKAVQNMQLREQRVNTKNGQAINNDQYRFAMGVVDPNLPTITEIHEELRLGQVQTNGPAPVPVHHLNGVASIQRTVRADVKFAPEDYKTQIGGMNRAMYFLIADTDGVWEFRLMPGGTVTHTPLAWAMTADDYDFVTGGTVNNGRRFSPTSARRYPNGLVLITSRDPVNDNPSAYNQKALGGDVFLLRCADYKTAAERVMAGLNPLYSAPANQANNRNPQANLNNRGWQPDNWVYKTVLNVTPLSASIRWRAGEPIDPDKPPTLRTQLSPPTTVPNPSELTGSYLPAQPSYADLVY